MRTLHTTLLALLLTVPLAAGDGPDGGDERVTGREFDNHGRLLVEYGLITDSDILFERHFRYVDQEARGGNGGDGNGGNGQSSDGSHLGTACASDAYKAAPWTWTTPYSASASSFASVFDAAGEVWDAATGADIFGGITSGSAGTAGQFDGVNQIDFAFLGTGGTIAVTTTWYNRFTGEAVESDGQYNTYYPWSTSGAAGAMDVLNIGVHEVGHTFGLDHPKGGPAISCLTMYAYANYGETQKRDLGDGDIVGIRAKYGA